MPTEVDSRAPACSILHATEMGLPVYQKLGFETVCEVQQYLWMPS